jgi:hypothetical protein
MSKNLTLKEEISKVLESTPSERARTIIDSTHTQAILEQLPAQETYLIIKDSWGSDSQILLQYVPPEAICRFIDLDCWEKDTLSVDTVLEWLWELYNASFDTFTQALETLDIEILVLLFQEYIEVVHVIPTDEHIPDLMDEGFESLDNLYFYRIIKDDDRSPLVKEMLSILFTNHQDLYYSIMEGVMFEMRSNLEETSYEQRSFRLMEMGFPPPDEALSIYQHIKREKLLNQGIIEEKIPIINEHLHMLPAVYLEHFSQGKGLLVKALADTDQKTKDRFVYEMIYLANKIVMADFKPLNEMTEIKHSMEKAALLTSLGLSVAMRDKGLPSGAILSTMNAETLFSLGYNTIYEQQRRLKLFLKEIELTMIPERFREYVDGLLKKRPLFKEREFATLEELEEVKTTIDRMETMAVLMDHLRWEDQIRNLSGTNIGANLDMENIILTSLVAGSEAQETRFRPLERSDVLDFLSSTTHVSAGIREIVPKFREDLPAYLSGLDDSIGRTMAEDIAAQLVFRLEEEISGIQDLDSLDPRFITCFTVKLSG